MNFKRYFSYSSAISFIFIIIILLIYELLIVLVNKDYSDTLSEYYTQEYKAKLLSINVWNTGLKLSGNDLWHNWLTLNALNNDLDSLNNDINSKIQELNTNENKTIADIKSLIPQLSLLNISQPTVDLSAIKKMNLNINSSSSQIEELVSQEKEVNDVKASIEANINSYKAGRKAEGKLVNELWGDTDQDLENVISNMTVEEKAGQLLMFEAQGTSMSSAYSNTLKAINAGGVILMGNNINNPSQLTEFTTSISKQSSIPIFISTDEEGDTVKRLNWDSTAGENQWSNLSDSQVCDLAKQRSQLLFQAGININLAPVVDLTYNGNAFINDRTISSNPEAVTDKAQSFVTCSQEDNVFTTMKHYPGHGATPLDSEQVLPEINLSKTDWLNSDALPYKEITNEDLVMVSHLLYKDIDPNNPASLSKTLVTDILRNKFGYNGVVITDSMPILQVTTNISVKDSLERAFNAGDDIALFVYTNNVFNKDEVLQTYQNVVNLIKNNRIPMQNVNDSLMRILKLKRKIVYQ